MGAATCVEIILAIFLPPLGVFLKYGCKVLSLDLSLLCLCFNLMVLTVLCGGGVAVGVLDLSFADHIGVHPWNSLCSLCPHQVNKPLR
ncbi:hypothetical protein RHSIM_Rhsim11G0105900 [Rhododendron simsii]|uniref:Uncharacterized protein n=1 Tax=Rhododendron simsii TaxID=118357 RepID=A0A834GBP5_RHOSS|nr:hypothetical protein RHSIM_Rhsim11G0105900 [Rhododendron simsii]